ncbi:glutamate-5-semialdehyde dehydrogenase [uncultured Tyzzerella sp.]|uniref:glutamate-5-semialdehyde dehydrogenase n=1 Tax=uncultured Tyzzerella sp. TaxID=2321398 RepID=UPI0029439801|nr:glutamate-5-semialdehyde dehydrogenase [uncultured Tyzzerella sp.]
MNLIKLCEDSKAASKDLCKLKSSEKNNILKACSNALLNGKETIIAANKIDIKNAKENNMKDSLIDRLLLDEKRIEDMANGILQIVSLDDPLDEYIDMKVLPNGLKVGKKRVAMGVIGIIYEARPNVTSDAFSMCFKASSSVILKGGKEALNSNKAIVDLFRTTIKKLGYNENMIILIEDTNRETTTKLMKMNQYIDLLIPRGGAGLIKAVVENSTIPVIETGVGNCHIFVDEYANKQKAIDIILNAKVQRPSVCNAMETLLIHKNIIDDILPELVEKLQNNNVEIRADKIILDSIGNKDILLATEDDWKQEFLDYILAIKCVENIDDAIMHIQKYSSGHSEAIITENYSNYNKFVDEIDSSVVYVNASTRFTDGEQFGLGAEIGISTQKLHARGPMGIKEITSYKYIVLGDGQIRE